jgi:hypothetical protein
MSMMLIKPFLNFGFGFIYCRVCIPLFCAYCFVVVMFHYNEHKKEQYMKTNKASYNQLEQQKMHYTIPPCQMEAQYLKTQRVSHKKMN